MPYHLMRLNSIKSLFCLLLLNACMDSAAQYNNIYEERAWNERDKWQKANVIIRAMDINATSKVADIGCHQGYMTVKLAKALKPYGHVYAVDVDDFKLKKLQQILEERELEENVEVIKGDYDDPKLPANALDAAIIMDTYHEMSSHMEILDHIMKALKPGGRLLILEPIADERNDWSRKDQERRHEIAIRYVLEDISKAGFELVEKFDPFIERKEKGDKMWMIVGKKPS